MSLNFYDRAVEASDEEGAYDQGALARKKGRPLASNPYDVEDDLFSSWSDGWYDANDDIEEGIEE